jgi:hypothetical protein
MKCASLVGALLAVSIFMLVVAADAQGPPAVNGPFRFDIAEAANVHRGPAVEGYLYNGLSWRITNVRLRIDTVDAMGRVTSQAHGWVMGDVPSASRAYFFIPISAYGATYRVSVESFDRISIEAP